MEHADVLAVLGWFIVALLSMLTVGTGYQWARNDRRIDALVAQVVAMAQALAVQAAIMERHEEWHRENLHPNISYRDSY